MGLALLNRLRALFWGDDPKDAALLMKLDFTILPYFSLIWFLFGLSRASYASAYISGMKTDLNFQGKDYNYLNTTYLVLYAVCQMPGTALLTVARPKYVFVTANVAWSVLTLITFKMNHAWQVILLNGFEGCFSAIAYAGAHFIYASWYKRSEIGTRAAIFVCFGQVGSMAGGWIQAGLLESLAVKNGLPAWRWIFIIVSVITIPIAIFGWFFIPDLPKHRNAWYLTEDEKDHAATRLSQPTKNRWDRTVFKRILLSWQFWLLPTIFMRNLPFLISNAKADRYLVYSLAIQLELNNVMQLWMASRGYSVIQQNNYPTGVYACAIVGTIFYSALSDRIRSRWQCSLCIGATFVLGSSILLANPSADGAHFFAYYFVGMAYAPQALWYAWMADVTAHDFQLRAVTTGFMNCFDFVFSAWWALVFYPVTDAPDYSKGYAASIVTGALILPMVGLITYLERRGVGKGAINSHKCGEDERILEGRLDESKGPATATEVHLARKY